MMTMPRPAVPTQSRFAHPLARWPQLLLALTLLSGCAAQHAFRDATALLSKDRPEDALAKLEEAVRLEPTSAAYRVAYLRTRDRLVADAIDQGDRARAGQQFDAAEKHYRRALGMDSASERAIAGLKFVERERRWSDWVTQAKTSIERKDVDGARLKLKAVLLENPVHVQARGLVDELDRATTKPTLDATLAAAYRKPVSLEFRDASIKTVFELLSKSAGLNFIFDKDVRTDQKVSIVLRNSTVEAAVSRLLVANQLEQRVLDEHSVMIYPDTPAKQKDYQLLTVKSFYLSNAEAKSVAGTLKTILKVRDVVVDERLNLVIMRDTPEAVRLAEKIVALHDVPEPEVMLDVEVLEVKRSRLVDLGVRWPQQVGFSPLASTGGAAITLADLRALNSARVGVKVDPLTVSANQSDSDANILANPRIRSKNREKARILIGDRVPNITSTSTSTGFVSDSVNYIDVGLKLEVEPTIYPDNEVAIKVALEVSSLVKQVETQSGTLAFQIGTRNASTVLRLKDGENQILAGLINDEDRRSADKIPALGEIPLAGRLFGARSDEKVKTEIVLSITPRLVRSLQRPEPAVMEFESGTESSLRSRGGMVVDAMTSVPAASRAPEPAAAASAPVAMPAASPGPAPSDVELRLQGPEQVRVGQAFTVELLLNPKAPLVSVPMAFGFDPAVLQVDAVEEGDVMAQGGAAQSLQSRVDPGGQVLITASRTGDGAATQSGKLVTLRLRALAAGRTTALQVLTVAPEGPGSTTLNAGLPPPWRVVVTP